jgi:DNA-binding CsgD family transcriptional regulator
LTIVMSLANPRHRPFIDETIRLVGRALGASRLVFYAVDRQQNLHGLALEGVPPECHRRYSGEMFAFDPLHVRRIAEHGVPVARLVDAAHYAPPDHIRLWASFMRAFGAVDALELLFRDGRTILAGLNVTWTERDPPTPATAHALAEQLQRYIQFNLTSRLVSARAARLEATCCFGLTPREREVALLVCEGHTTQAIATCLAIEPSTVKTHLLSIYEKCEVDSRAGLVGRLSDPAC